jgi:signal peptidase I
MSMKLRWFLSRQFRHTSGLWSHLRKLRDAQCDLLAPQALESLDAALRETKAALDANADDAVLAARAAELEQAAQQFLTPYPHPEWRDNVEVLLVAIALAMGIRTFFAQPFKIPTGSMQPTLYGITLQDRRDDPNFLMPGPLKRAYEFAVHGAIYHQAIAPDDGEFDHISPLQHVLGLVNKQTIWVRYRHSEALAPIVLWCGPDESQFDSIEHRLGLVDETHTPNPFHKGQAILQCVEFTGDHLFVDRLTYNFRRPARGEIIVFKTTGIPISGQIADQFYIKRLIGLPGETLSIGDDRHVRVNRVRLDAATPHFKEVYGFDPQTRPRESHYSGHVLAPGFPDNKLKTSADTLKIGQNRCAVFGDNTMNSKDSRYWGDFPEKNILGRALLVYWPYSSRFGLTVQR